ncbi:DinB family protein [Flavihumibacter sp. CACIAM 22H1]|uniref:DinB family protein n=1 Tax=Flavihumibacter sp. CACIAM 22H1 TaxID=1812911 RepID=UPI000A959114|nr:DinB family protein [Flavihumibacter sp. CACIAM 22H1]
MYNIIHAPFYDTYVKLVKTDDLRKTLRKNTEELLAFFEEIPEEKIGFAYADGKWTIKQVVQHIIDAERIFAYRALRVARLDATPLPGFDENLYAANANVAVRGWEDMLKELRQLRKSNLRMIKAFTEEQLNAEGVASGHPVSAAAICFIMAGHAKHHINIIRERYL